MHLDKSDLWACSLSLENRCVEPEVYKEDCMVYWTRPAQWYINQIGLEEFEYWTTLDDLCSAGSGGIFTSVDEHLKEGGIIINAVD